MRASRYYITPTVCILITEWEKRGANLSLPVTKGNLNQWRYVIKHHVLEYWRCFPQEYKAALQQIGHPKEENWRRHNLAVDRVEQAFRDLVRLR